MGRPLLLHPSAPRFYQLGLPVGQGEEAAGVQHVLLRIVSFPYCMRSIDGAKSWVSLPSRFLYYHFSLGTVARRARTPHGAGCGSAAGAAGRRAARRVLGGSDPPRSISDRTREVLLETRSTAPKRSQLAPRLCSSPSEEGRGLEKGTRSTPRCHRTPWGRIRAATIPSIARCCSGVPGSALGAQRGTRAGTSAGGRALSGCCPAPFPSTIILLHEASQAAAPSCSVAFCSQPAAALPPPRLALGPRMEPPTF